MFWHFKLIWAAVLMLQYRRICSTEVYNPAVSLKCTEEGAVPAINCTINLTLHDCMGDEFKWKDFEGNDICNSGDYDCDWDNRTYVSLVITKAAKCEPYKVSIDATCGVGSSEISVTHCGDGPPHRLPDFPVVTVSAVIFILLLVLGTLCILFWTRKGKAIFKSFTKVKTTSLLEASPI